MADTDTKDARKPNQREMICISCPMGCHLTASWTDMEDIEVTGNRCKRGVTYGTEEIRAPKRVVTATAAVAVEEGLARVPVKTDGPLLKEHIDDLLNRLYTLELPGPVALGDTVLEDIGGTGVNLVATRTVPVI